MSDVPQDSNNSEQQPPEGGFQQPTPPGGDQAPPNYQQPTPPPHNPPQDYQQPGPPPSYQQQGYIPQPGVPAPGYVLAPQYPEESGALFALLMSILGLVVCSGLLCPVGWYYGNKELEAIDEGRRDPSKRDMAVAARVIGIIGSLLLAVGIGFVVLFFGIALIGVAAG